MVCILQIWEDLLLISLSSDLWIFEAFFCWYKFQENLLIMRSLKQNQWHSYQMTQSQWNRIMSRDIMFLLHDMSSVVEVQRQCNQSYAIPCTHKVWPSRLDVTIYISQFCQTHAWYTFSSRPWRSPKLRNDSPSNFNDPVNLCCIFS